jgi:hypothetical protein
MSGLSEKAHAEGLDKDFHRTQDDEEFYPSVL